MQRDVKHPKVRIIQMRKAKGWSQRELAKIAGVNNMVLHYTEHGYGVSLLTALKIAKAFGTTVEKIWPQ